MKTGEIQLGALSETIAEQVARMGLEHDGNIKFIDRLADAATLLNLHGVLTDTECKRARARIVKHLKLRKIEPGQ